MPDLVKYPHDKLTVFGKKAGGDCPATSCSLLEWADENLLKAECITSEIADTGDYDSMWHVEDCDGRKSYGQTLTEAIQDGMKGDDDPTRYDYVPPEFR